MQRDNEYSFRSRVRFSEIDHTKKITLPGIINYFQDASTFQSEILGLGVDYLAEHGRAWVLSAWQVEVLRYPQIMEEISVHTWASGFKGMLGDRNFCMKDSEGQVIACANSLWVYMDMKKGRPAIPPKEELDLYGVGEPLDLGHLGRKIALPDDLEEKEAFTVRRYHIDTNEHVNNCQYVQMAMEFMEEQEIKHLRVEYKNSAVYKDVIVPKIGKEENRTVVALCSEAGKPYAIVEVRSQGEKE